jgi:hypothetical protein
MKGRIVFGWIGLGDHVERPEVGQGNNEQKTKALTIVRTGLAWADSFDVEMKPGSARKYIPKNNGACKKLNNLYEHPALHGRARLWHRSQMEFER